MRAFDRQLTKSGILSAEEIEWTFDSWELHMEGSAPEPLRKSPAKQGLLNNTSTSEEIDMNRSPRNALASATMVYGAMILLSTAGVENAAAGMISPLQTEVPGGPVLEFDTELVEMNITGGPFPLPLARDPNNDLGDSVDGYGFVNSEVSWTLSSQRSNDPGQATTGRTVAYPADGSAGRFDPIEDIPDDELPTIDPAELDGTEFHIDSFFDEYSDFTITDVDDRPGRDYAGQADGATLVAPDNGPVRMQSSTSQAESPVIFDADAPNFGLVPPPEGAPYIGYFELEIPLGADINDNGENDKIKFTLVTRSLEAENRTFNQLPDGTITGEFDTGATMEGAVVDESTDPPFFIGQIDPDTNLPDPDVFGGSISTQTVLNNLTVDTVVPEPSSLALLGFGTVSLLGYGWRRKWMQAA